MPMTSPEKLYYSISDVAEETGVAPHILRYWETQFKQLKPRRSSTGVRQYRKRDLDLIQIIVELLYTKRYTIEGARAELSQAKSRASSTPFPTETKTTQSSKVAVPKIAAEHLPARQLEERPQQAVVEEQEPTEPTQIGLDFDNLEGQDSLLNPNDENFERIIEEVRKRYRSLPENERHQYFHGLPVTTEEEDAWLEDLAAMARGEVDDDMPTSKKNRKLEQDNKELRKQLKRIRADLLGLKKLL